MQIVIAPGRLRDGVTEEEMLAASDRFQNELVAHHPGVLRRVLVADPSGGYADIVFFADEATIGQVMEAEQTNEAAGHFLGLWEPAEPAMYRVLQVHGSAPFPR